jgi:uncharacterized phage infection (PIP) family protein YhgE
MEIDKDGKLGMFARMDMRVIEEFGWNMEDMATAIRELRDDIEKMQKELEKANEASGEQF